jgi:hypothetical protein
MDFSALSEEGHGMLVAQSGLFLPYKSTYQYGIHELAYVDTLSNDIVVVVVEFIM